MTNDGQFVYEWDDTDRLKEVRTLNGDLVMTCKYDGLGRRRERIVASVAGVGDPGTNRYVYHDPAGGGASWLVLEVRDGGNNVIESYTHVPDLSGTLGGAGGIGGILSCSTGGTNRWFHYDGNGSVIACTDTNRAVVSRLEYAPFGTVLTKSGPYTPRYQFSSKEFDAAVGLNYYGFRFYSPGLGRWLSRDPIGEEALFVQYLQNLSLSETVTLAEQYYEPSYLFVRNAPSFDIDPLGLAPVAGGCNEEQKQLLRECLGMSDEEAKKCDDESKKMCDGLSDAMKDMMLAPIKPGPGAGKIKRGICWLIKKAVVTAWKKTDPGEKFPDKPPQCPTNSCPYEPK